MKAMENMEIFRGGQHQSDAGKEGWAWKPLGEVCKTGSGGTPLSSRREYYEGGDIPWLLSGEVAQGNVREAKNFITKAGLESSAARLFPKGTILVAMYGATAGQVGILRFEAATNQAVCGILPNEKFVPEFLFYFFLAQKDELVAQATGNAQPNISQIKIKNTEVPLPPLPEQHRIVALLDEAFAGHATAKANTERNLQNARAIFESHLQSVFSQRGEGWVERTLGNLCDFLNGFAFNSGDAVTESQAQLVRMGNLYGNQLDLDRNPVFYPDSFATEHSRYVLKEHDIIMSLTGTTGKEDYGFAVRIPDCGHILLMNQRIMKFDAIRHDIIDDGYLLHYLRSRCFLDILYPTANGTRQANLSSVTIKLLPVPLCTLKEQKVIANKLDDLHDETQHLTRLYERKLAALEELKQSLLHQAFNGEL
jgi:type I restriction enzyme S subunit